MACLLALAAGLLLHCSSFVDAKLIVVKPPQPAGNGGLLGQVPINYGPTSRARTGWFYLPKGYKGKSLPLMVALHGSGGSGRDMIGAFMALADKHRFVIVAPDSHDTRGWLAAASTTERWTYDMIHIRDCYKWAIKAYGLKPRKGKITMTGFSAGGFLAGQFATLPTKSSVVTFSHGMALHSAMYSYRLGSNKAKLWLSTGARDGNFTPATVKSFAAGLRTYGYSVTYRTYPGGHDLGSKAELSAAVNWWLG